VVYRRPRRQSGKWSKLSRRAGNHWDKEYKGKWKVPQSSIPSFPITINAPPPENFSLQPLILLSLWIRCLIINHETKAVEQHVFSSKSVNENNAIEQYFPEVLLTVLFNSKVILTQFESVDQAMKTKATYNIFLRFCFWLSALYRCSAFHLTNHSPRISSNTCLHGFIH